MTERRHPQAERLCYFLDEGYSLKLDTVRFDFFRGFDRRQKGKSIVSFLEEAAKKFGTNKNNILEICKTSPIELGQKLSAFQLELTLRNTSSNVERFFQGAKVFEKNDLCGKSVYGPFEEIISNPRLHPKRYESLKEALGKVKNGELGLIRFQLLNEEYPLNPKTFFYDYLYITALIQNEELSKQLSRYRYFSDIEFNPRKSINCQARSAAIYVSMRQKDILDKYIEEDEHGRKRLNREKFLEDYERVAHISL